MKTIKAQKLACFLLFFNCFPFVSYVRSEPWIDVRDPWLRADIEMLADVGIINTPITTYPLMWSGIIQDIDNTLIDNVPDDYKSAFWRVKNAGKKAFRKNTHQELNISAINTPKNFRQFGDESREKVEVSARKYSMNDDFAWNIEVTQVGDPADGKKTRYDGSYISLVTANWVTTLGAVEKWWGAGWDSTNLLSNNARPPLGISLQRNYSNPSDSAFWSWLGPWTVHSFIAQLNDKRAIKNANLTGVSFTFKPHKTVEVGLRSTALWGGEKRPKSVKNFFNNVIGNQLCLAADSIECSEYYSGNGDRIAGVDFRWQLPVGYPVSIYASQYGEDETQFLPKKNMTQLGITSSFSVANTRWKWFVEESDTALDKKQFNRAYESDIYTTGYRYQGRIIGSTYDNDAKNIAFGVKARLNATNALSFNISQRKLKNTELQDNQSALVSQNDQFSAMWSLKTSRFGTFRVKLNYQVDKIIETGQSNSKKDFRIGLDWKYQLN